MIDRAEFRAQQARLQLTNTELAKRTDLSDNTIRAFMRGADSRISVLSAITEALGGEITIAFKRVSDDGRSRLDAPFLTEIGEVKGVT